MSGRVEIGLDFADVAEEAATLVTLLESVNGDIDAFAKLFDIGRENAMHVLTKTLMTLNDPENGSHLFKWNCLVAAYKQAKVLIAERNAINFLSEYEMPSNTGDTKAPLSTVISLSRFWLGDHNAAQTTRARKNANEAMPQGQASEQEKILESLADDEDE